ncbi:hypothetical protein TNIN_202831 [Trichonephila inaurata madagascariensis]|uniref:Uncharacterized protein n=1 Tax=Trichonephila inaurata madagascariensis TaxID=2747483 RepID=A0A8X7C0T1_9ARAC|nr:hypothetical protein TNIN_202831 [Trichonephila inaurata madagascariensis]
MISDNVELLTSRILPPHSFQNFPKHRHGTVPSCLGFTSLYISILIVLSNSERDGVIRTFLARNSKGTKDPTFVSPQHLHRGRKWVQPYLLFCRLTRTFKCTDQ